MTALYRVQTTDFHNWSMTCLDRDLNDLRIHEDRSFTVSVTDSMCRLKSADDDMVTPRSLVKGLSWI